MQLGKVKEELQSLVVLTERMIDNNLKNNGDTCEFSQRTCLLNALKYFEQNISGINYDDALDDESSIERIGNVISVNGKPINESHDVEYRLIEREEIISDLIDWIGECDGVDCCLMKQDLEMLIGWTDTWILSSNSTNEYISLSYDKVNFIEQCKVLANGVSYA